VCELFRVERFSKPFSFLSLFQEWPSVPAYQNGFGAYLACFIIIIIYFFCYSVVEEVVVAVI